MDKSFWLQKTEKEQQAALAALQELLAIPSINAPAEENAPFGKEIARALDFTLNLGEDLGFVCHNLDGYAGIIDLKANEDSETVGLLCHLDVVPPDGEWQTPPFSPEIRDGKIFARGAVDDKGPLIAALFAMKAVKESGLPLSKNIRLICGTDEETDFRCVEYYKQHEPAPACGFSPDGDFPVVFAEKGIAHFEFIIPLYDEKRIIDLAGGEASNIVPASCTLRFDRNLTAGVFLQESEKVKIHEEENCFIITTAGKAAHASIPHKGENAISAMLGILAELPLQQDLQKSLQTLYNLFGKCLDGSDAGLGYCDEISGNMTVAANMIELCEDGIKLTFDMRYAVTDNFDRIEGRLQEICLNNNWGYKLLGQKAPLDAGKDSPLVRTLNSVYNDIMDSSAEPIAIGGGTYSRAFRNFVAFGPVFPDQPEVAHMSNEYLEVESFFKLLHIYAQAIYELAK
ncbi:MAG: Sapep family Mn(2+)-dependent dipeptidase [Firmicutes bacterium]|nr:Sapep family Mn(2+)-dependent dipeptidase [Bacillota bacterium]